jgi:hypothetical protein
MEVQPSNNLHFLVEEMQRWRGIMGDIYLAHKHGRLNKTPY